MPTIRRLAVAALVIAAALQASLAHAESGWTFYRGTWIPYTVHHHHSAQLAGRALMVTLASEKAAAVRRARLHRDGHLRLLAQSGAVVATARLSLSIPTWFYGVAPCLAKWEEGSANSSAGYFGFVEGPPSVYIDPGPQLARAYGDSWWSVPYTAQLGMAWAEYRAYGWSPTWGPHTLEMCGLG